MNEHASQSETEQNKRVHTVEYAGPLTPLPGEIAIKEADRLGWASHSKLSEMAKLGQISRRQPSPHFSYVKLDELKKIFGETPPGVTRRRRTEKTKTPTVPLNITKEERRIIFGEIDSHYLDESRGYAEGWDDEKVAASLKVPVGWVRSVREENFGPEKGDEVSLAVKELQSYVADADVLMIKIRTVWMERDQIIKKMVDDQNRIVNESKKVHAAIDIARSKINRLIKKK